MTKLFKSKTLWFSFALVALGLLEQIAPVVTPLIPEEYRGLALAGVGFVTAALRLVTSKPVKEL